MSTQNPSVTLDPEISEWIAALHRQSIKLPWTEYKQWCFTHLLNICPFDSGLWWSRSDLVKKSHAHWADDTSLYNQSFEFMENYARIAARPNNPDPLNLRLNDSIGRFFSIWDVVPKARWWQSDYYLEHCQPYGIENAISAMTLPSKYSSVSHIFSFYRAQREAEFSADEKAILASLLPHLLQAFSANLMSSFERKNNASVSAVVDRYGKVVMAEEGFTTFMTEKGLLHNNQLRIPQLGILTEPATVKLNDMTLELTFHEGLIYIEVYEVSLLSRLSERQKEVCQLLSKGLTNKEIADLLELKVNTVNNHVQRALRALKVTSREAATAYLVRQEG